MTQEMIAAGPAVASAVFAPNNHPEPMIDPIDAQSSEMSPISRRNDRVGVRAGSSSMTAMTELPFMQGLAMTLGGRR